MKAFLLDKVWLLGARIGGLADLKVLDANGDMDFHYRHGHWADKLGHRIMNWAHRHGFKYYNEDGDEYDYLWDYDIFSGAFLQPGQQDDIYAWLGCDD